MSLTYLIYSYDPNADISDSKGMWKGFCQFKSPIVSTEASATLNLDDATMAVRIRSVEGCQEYVKWGSTGELLICKEFGSPFTPVQQVEDFATPLPSIKSPEPQESDVYLCPRQLMKKHISAHRVPLITLIKSMARDHYRTNFRLCPEVALDVELLCYVLERTGSSWCVQCKKIHRPGQMLKVLLADENHCPLVGTKDRLWYCVGFMCVPIAGDKTCRRINWVSNVYYNSSWSKCC